MQTNLTSVGKHIFDELFSLKPDCETFDIYVVKPLIFM